MKLRLTILALIFGSVCILTQCAQGSDAADTNMDASEKSFLPIVTRPAQIPEIIATLDWFQPTEIKVNPQNGNIYIVNGQGNVFVSLTQGIERVSNTQIAGSRFISFALDEERDLLYVGTHFDNIVSILKNGELVVEIELPSDKISDIFVDPATHRTYIVGDDSPVTTGNTNKGYVFVVEDTRLINTISLGSNIPKFIERNPTNGNLYIGGSRRVSNDPENSRIGTIDIIDGQKRIELIEVGASIFNLAFAPSGIDLYAFHSARYVNGETQGSLSIIRNDAVVQTIDAGNPTGVTNHAFHPLTQEYQILAPGLVIMYESKPDGTIIERERLELREGSRPQAFDPVTGNLYVTRHQYNQVDIYNGSKLFETIEVGQYPWRLAINPTNGWVYVSNSEGNTVTVLGYK